MTSRMGVRFGGCCRDADLYPKSSLRHKDAGAWCWECGGASDLIPDGGQFHCRKDCETTKSEVRRAFYEVWGRAA